MLASVVAFATFTMVGLAIGVTEDITYFDGTPLIGRGGTATRIIDKAVFACGACSLTCLFYFLLRQVDRARQGLHQLVESRTKALQRTNFMVENASEGIFTVGSNGRILYANRVACQRLEYSHDELLQLTISDIDPHYPTELWLQRWEELRQKRQDVIQTEYQAKSGKRYPVEASIASFQYAGSEYCCFFIRDISDRLEAENALRHANEELENRVAVRTRELSVANDRLRSEVVHRREAERLLHSIAEGTSSDVGEGFFSALVHQLAAGFNVHCALVTQAVDWPTTRLRTLAIWLDQKFGENIEFEIKDTPCEQTARGSAMFIPRGAQQLFPSASLFATLRAESYGALPLLDSSGAVIGHLAIIDDEEMQVNVTDEPALRIFAARAAAELERKRTEEALLRQQVELAHVARLNMMGELVSGLAHELNQPLTAVVNLADVLQQTLVQQTLVQQQHTLDERLVSLSSRIGEQAYRAGEIIRQMRSLVSKRAPERLRVDINQLIRESVSLVQSELRLGGIEMQLLLAPELPRVAADPIQMQQVVLNLVRNAHDALLASDTPSPRLTIETMPSGDEAVEVRVADTGAILSDEVRENVFTPFFTTKPEGMGMGLAICRTIVESHGGRLWCNAGDQKETEFHFTIGSNS